MNTEIDIIDVTDASVKITSDELRGALICTSVIAAGIIAAIIIACVSKRLRPAASSSAIILLFFGPLSVIAAYPGVLSGEHTVVKDVSTALAERYGSASEVACPDRLATSVWTDLRGAGNTCYQIKGGDVVAVKKQDGNGGYQLTVEKP